MKVIHVGEGHRSRDWLEVVRRHPEARSVAVVAADRGRIESVPELQNASFATLRDAVGQIEADAAVLTGNAVHDQSVAIEALEAGLAVVLDRPPVVSLEPLARIGQIARDTGRPVTFVHDVEDAPDAGLRRLLGKVGAVTHVSYIDRRLPAGLDEPRPGTAYAQLIHFGLGHFDSLRRLFGRAPVRIMARCETPPWGPGGPGATTAAFLELEGDLHVQYFGSIASNRTEHRVWIEGAQGSLQMDGPGIWWRKRGWPRFLPWRWRLAAAADAERRWADGAMRALTEVRDALARTASGAGALHPIALLGAAIASDRLGAVVEVGEWLAGEPELAAASGARG